MAEFLGKINISRKDKHTIKEMFKTEIKYGL